MFIEFVGRSGTGKSALCRRVLARLSDRPLAAVRPVDVLLGARAAQCISSDRSVNFILETLGIPWMWIGRRQLPDLDRLVRAWIDRASHCRRERRRLTRSWRRKIGVLYGCRRASVHRDVLLDEGSVHFASIVFGRLDSYSDSDLDRYLRAVPLPDIVVHVEAPLTVSDDRLMSRGMPPAPDRDMAARTRYLRRADHVLRQLAEHPRIAERRIVACNARQGLASLDALAEEVAQYIADRCRWQRAAWVTTERATLTPRAVVIEPATDSRLSAPCRARWEHDAVMTPQDRREADAGVEVA